MTKPRSFAAIARRAQDRRWRQLMTVPMTGDEAMRVGLAVANAAKQRHDAAKLADVWLSCREYDTRKERRILETMRHQRANPILDRRFVDALGTLDAVLATLRTEEFA